jgi:hypothetical protein
MEIYKLNKKFQIVFNMIIIFNNKKKKKLLIIMNMKCVKIY